LIYIAPMISVLLPTAARPELLEVALKSIAGQTALNRIDRVLVSENGSDPRSREVCAKFPHVPINYNFRDPATAPIDHGRWLMTKAVEGDDIDFILHDDDWWRPKHVETALHALDAAPDASCYVANNLFFKDGQSIDEEPEIAPWFGANFPDPTAPTWRLTPMQVIMGSIFQTIGHFSGWVVRTDALQKSAYTYELGNTFDIDRMQLVAIARERPMIFGREITVCVRLHPNRDSDNFSHDSRERHHLETTRWMIEASGKPWSAIASQYVQRLVRCPHEKTRQWLTYQSIIRDWCLPEMARQLNPVKDKAFFDMYEPARKKFEGHSIRYER
jgi:glycosyltransferase involved in cell wall biosynthesis